MLSPAKKILILLVLSLLFIPIALTSLPTITHAQGEEEIVTGAEGEGGEPLAPEDVTADTYSGFGFQNFIGNALPCAIIGTDFIKKANEKNCIGYNPETGTEEIYAYMPGGGALGGVGTLMAAVYTPSTSTTEYLASIGHDFGVVPEAYAQQSGVAGSGQGVVKPVLAVWQVIRNVAYLAFIILFLVTGFMIMFRQKLNPQTVISIQAALPGLVIGLVLVTFSYFISALIIDLSFIGMDVVAFLFAQAGDNAVNEPLKVARDSNVIALFRDFVLQKEHFDKLAGPIKDVFQQSVASVVKSDTPFIGGPIHALTGGVGMFVGFLVLLILLVAALFQMLRLLWALITAYITILMITIFSPFFILFASLPGKGAIMTSWWKTLLGNVLIFPAVFAAFLFAGYFLKAVDATSLSQTPPLFGGLPTSVIQIMIAYGIMLGTPAIPKMVKDALGVKDLAGGLTEAATAGWGAGAAPIMGAVGGAWAGGMSKGFGAQARAGQAVQEHNRKVEYERVTGETLGPGGTPVGPKIDRTPRALVGHKVAGWLAGNQK